ncbi:hypothetical protein PUNSTDRAFT_55624 [Punctularia strigosozonata HHB-11173 SS5]|uniref:Uncharacterized protein n=1 Tax=Punctularia strigosozonata (strain HHB-11173) TaxID=741275 RepID=R7S2C8_PUNST|nr:uncharacterized protein PUNSTDRAFT_55624 [Punctularia strigosozonata HHB-11173 SS5]EIN04358.1 hypothetical protein PUNSTDRAFT_55624 [Punctularia strigosozonata HHB-11173 SS5]
MSAVESHATSSSSDSVVPRGRGRPKGSKNKKTLLALQLQAASQHPSGHNEVVKRPRGRPRKHPIPDASLVKRPRGRPRKHPLPLTQATSADEPRSRRSFSASSFSVPDSGTPSSSGGVADWESSSSSGGSAYSRWETSRRTPFDVSSMSNQQARAASSIAPNEERSRPRQEEKTSMEFHLKIVYHDEDNARKWCRLCMIQTREQENAAHVKLLPFPIDATPSSLIQHCENMHTSTWRRIAGLPAEQAEEMAAALVVKR